MTAVWAFVAADNNVREYQTVIRHSMELVDRKRLEWEDTLDAHRQTVRQEWQDLAVLREKFRNLAETDDPDEQLVIYLRSESSKRTGTSSRP